MTMNELHTTMKLRLQLVLNKPYVNERAKHTLIILPDPWTLAVVGKGAKSIHTDNIVSIYQRAAKFLVVKVEILMIKFADWAIKA